MTDVGGAPVAEMGLVPSLFVTRTLAALRRATPMPRDERVAALRRAGELFAAGSPDGLDRAAYEFRTSRVSGVPLSVVREATDLTRRRLEQVDATVEGARPAGAVADSHDPATRYGAAVWARRGDVLGVHVAGVHPGAHGMWPEALALGFRVAVRPNRREPFTAQRMVAALHAAGFPEDHVALLPTDHEAAEAMVDGADLVYGGDDVVRAHSEEPWVLAQRPGRSKILLARDVDWREHLDTIVDSVAHHGGAGCVNATGLLVEGDPRPVAQAVAQRLAALPSHPPEHDAAVLPVQGRSPARALERFLAERAGDATAVLGGDGIVDDLGTHGCVLRPAVHVLDRPDERLGVELPFPCLWVAPWSADDGIVLGETLALTVLSRNDDLIDAVLAAPDITNVHVGDRPTHWTAVGLPHEGHLADFLMRTRVVARS